MREELSNLVLSAMKEAEEYQDSFERYSYLWMDDPQEFMKNFLIYGRAATLDDLDTRAEEALPKTPPSLAQFQQQVRVSLAPSRDHPPAQGGRSLGSIQTSGERFQNAGFIIIRVW